MQGIQNTNLISNYQSIKNNKAAEVNQPVSQCNAPDTDLPVVKQSKNPLHLLVLGLVATLAGGPVSQYMTKCMKKDAELGIKNESADKVLNQMFVENKLKEKGVTKYIAPVNSKEYKTLMDNFGGAVFYYSKEQKINQIETVADNFSSALHETGHAINCNCTKSGRMYWNFHNKLAQLTQKVPEGLRKYIQISPLFTAIVLSSSFLGFGLIGNIKKKNNSADQDDQSNKFSIKKLVHDHLGKLTVASFIPVLMDESTATIRALKATKKVAPEMLKPLRRNLLFGLGSYFVQAGAALASALLLRKYVDALTTNKQDKK